MTHMLIAQELLSYKLWVWYDYFSVPQAPEATAERKLAIHSIPRPGKKKSPPVLVSLLGPPVVPFLTPF